jgi:hypothetical protein
MTASPPERDDRHVELRRLTHRALSRARRQQWLPWLFSASLVLLALFSLAAMLNALAASAQTESYTGRMAALETALAGLRMQPAAGLDVTVQALTTAQPAAGLGATVQALTTAQPAAGLGATVQALTTAQPAAGLDATVQALATNQPDVGALAATVQALATNQAGALAANPGALESTPTSIPEPELTAETQSELLTITISTTNEQGARLFERAESPTSSGWTGNNVMLYLCDREENSNSSVEETRLRYAVSRVAMCSEESIIGWINQRPWVTNEIAEIFQKP